MAIADLFSKLNNTFVQKFKKLYAEFHIAMPASRANVPK